jgi:thiamine biosynthesis lipoprotein ApbE
MSGVAAVAVEPISIEAHLMGGLVGVHLRPARPPVDGRADGDRHGTRRARHEAVMTLRRIGSWADRLTRFSDTSDLSRLNADSAPSVRVRPTLGAVLVTAQTLGRETDGIVDPTVLVERLAAEDPTAAWAATSSAPSGAVSAGRRWSIEPGRRGAVVSRAADVRFDLGGVAKGWIADRAAASLSSWPAVLVDADGDLAIALDYNEAWSVAIADPRTDGATLGTFEVIGLDPARPQRFGLATSGTSVHRWAHDGLVTRHRHRPGHCPRGLSDSCRGRRQDDRHPGLRPR